MNIEFSKIEAKVFWRNLSPEDRLLQYKSIKKIGSISYGKDSPKPSEEFIDMLVKNGHLSCLEHTNINLKYYVDKEKFPYINFDEFFNMCFSPCLKYEIEEINEGKQITLFGNLTIFYETLKYIKEIEEKYEGRFNYYYKLILYFTYRFLIDKGYHIFKCEEYEWLKTSILEYFINHYLENTGFYVDFTNTLHRYSRLSVRVVCPRTCSHQIVRHRTCSFNQESSRRVKYNKTLPFSVIINDKKEELNVPDYAKEFLEYSRITYDRLLNDGFKTQEARNFLPNGLRTQLYITATLNDWYRMYLLRHTKHTEPIFREIIEQIKDEILGLNLKYYKW